MSDPKEPSKSKRGPKRGASPTPKEIIDESQPFEPDAEKEHVVTPTVESDPSGPDSNHVK